MIRAILEAILRVPGFAGSIEFSVHVNTERKEIRVVPKITANNG